MTRRSQLSYFHFILKALAIAALTYFGLYINAGNQTSHEHLRQQDSYNKKYFIEDIKITGKEQQSDSILEEMVQEIDELEHRVAVPSQQNSMKSICSQYASICKRTSFDTSNLSDKQKLYYQVLTIYALKKISDTGIPVLSYVDNITIKYSSSKSRGYSSRNQIILDVKAMNGYAEFLQVLIHELGHMVDFRYLAGTESGPKDSVFTEFGKKVFPLDDPSLDFYALSRINENTRSRSSSYLDFVSGYGMTDPFEDIAETIIFYQNYRDIFQELTTQSDVLLDKYNFVDSIFGGQFINNGLKKKSQFEEFNRDFRPYDATRF